MSAVSSGCRCPASRSSNMPATNVAAGFICRAPLRTSPRALLVIHYTPNACLPSAAGAAAPSPVRTQTCQIQTSRRRAREADALCVRGRVAPSAAPAARASRREWKTGHPPHPSEGREISGSCRQQQTAVCGRIGYRGTQMNAAVPGCGKGGWVST